MRKNAQKYVFYCIPLDSPPLLLNFSEELHLSPSDVIVLHDDLDRDLEMIHWKQMEAPGKRFLYLSIVIHLLLIIHGFASIPLFFIPLPRLFTSLLLRFFIPLPLTFCT